LSAEIKLCLSPNGTDWPTLWILELKIFRNDTRYVKNVNLRMGMLRFAYFTKDAASDVGAQTRQTTARLGNGPK
jgi:hypothetical protein